MGKLSVGLHYIISTLKNEKRTKDGDKSHSTAISILVLDIGVYFITRKRTDTTQTQIADSRLMHNN